MSTREEQGAIITEAARRIGTDPTWLDALINFETGGTYDTLVKNPMSSARGLIQLTDAPARDMGYADSLAAVTDHSDFEDQMFNVVVPYFKLKARQNGIESYMSQQSLYMAVFYPRYWNTDPSTPFPPDVQAVNPGISTPDDYINFVNNRIQEGELRVPFSLGPILMIAGIGLTGLLIWMSSRRR